jgi:diphthamide biosynthesis protein 2
MELSISDDDIVIDFDIDSTCDWIVRRSFRRVALQFPDELLKNAQRVQQLIRSKLIAIIDKDKIR